MLLRAVGIAVPAMKAVEVPWLVSRMDGHAGEARLLEIEDARGGETRPEGGGVHGL